MSNLQKQSACKAFTTEGRRKLTRLTNEVTIGHRGNRIACVALWDTGAAITCISRRIIQTLNLIPTGNITILSASGRAKKGMYLVDITLPNKVTIPHVTVSEAELVSNIDVLIGMDIIGNGDFAVSNFQDNTVFSFRIPSIGKVDFCEENADQNLPVQEESDVRNV